MSCPELIILYAHNKKVIKESLCHLKEGTNSKCSTCILFTDKMYVDSEVV